MALQPIPYHPYYKVNPNRWVKYKWFQVTEVNANLNPLSSGFLNTGALDKHENPAVPYLIMRQRIEEGRAQPYQTVVEEYRRPDGTLEGTLCQSFGAYDGVSVIGEEFGFGNQGRQSQEYGPVLPKIVYTRNVGYTLNAPITVITRDTPNNGFQVREQTFYFRRMADIPGYQKYALVEFREDGTILDHYYNYFYNEIVGRKILLQIKIEEAATGVYTIRYNDDGICGNMWYASEWGHEAPEPLAIPLESEPAPINYIPHIPEKPITLGPGANGLIQMAGFGDGVARDELFSPEFSYVFFGFLRMFLSGIDFAIQRYPEDPPIIYIMKGTTVNGTPPVRNPTHKGNQLDFRYPTISGDTLPKSAQDINYEYLYLMLKGFCAWRDEFALQVSLKLLMYEDYLKAFMDQTSVGPLWGIRLVGCTDDEHVGDMEHFYHAHLGATGIWYQAS